MTPPNLSLIFIMIFFWVTMWLVHRFLIQPIGGALAERHGRIDSATSKWETTNREYLEATDRLELEMQEAAREAARVRGEYRQQALDRRQVALDEARTVADEKLHSALDGLEGETTAARQDLRSQSRELAEQFASRLLDRKVAP